jgi:glycosyltransferase involved in cell wall biosynthesis
MINDQLPLISVIIRSYNREECLGRAINSALNQTYPNIEIIVVNDGSTDNTLKMLNSLKSKKIKIISHTKNLGLVAALNSGFNQVSNNSFAISFLDSDDVWIPDHLSILSNKMRSDSHLGFVYGQTSGRKKITIEGCDLYREILQNKALAPLCALLVRKELANEVFPIISNVNMCEDDRFCYELSKRSCFSFVSEITFIPIGAKNSVTRNRKQIAEGWGSLLEDYSLDILQFCGLDVLRKRRIDQFFLWLFAGEIKKARKEFESILKLKGNRVKLFFAIVLHIPFFMKNNVTFFLNYYFPKTLNSARGWVRDR